MRRLENAEEGSVQKSKKKRKKEGAHLLFAATIPEQP